MRIIGGDLKGRRLRAPAGLHTRPTADAVREALFNILGPPPEGAAALDLFAGTGALGLEALSRGVERVVFVEKDPRACRALQHNLAALSLLGRAEVLVQPVQRALARLDGRSGGTFFWIFADPPYQAGLLPEVLDTLGAAGCPLLAPGGVIVVEHLRRGDDGLPGPVHGALLRCDLRCYGQSALSFYARPSDRDEHEEPRPADNDPQAGRLPGQL